MLIHARHKIGIWELCTKTQMILGNITHQPSWYIQLEDLQGHSMVVLGMTPTWMWMMVVGHALLLPPTHFNLIMNVMLSRKNLGMSLIQRSRSQSSRIQMTAMILMIASILVQPIRPRSLFQAQHLNQHLNHKIWKIWKIWKWIRLCKR